MEEHIHQFLPLPPLLFYVANLLVERNYSYSARLLPVVDDSCILID